MGDRIEFTSPKDGCVFYKVTGSALRFYVKGKGSAFIGLASSPTDEIFNKIVIGNKYSWIVREKKIKTPDVILEHEYRPFWLSWYGKHIRLGIGSNATPIAIEARVRDIWYVTFSTYKHSSVQFQLPLKILEPIYKKIDTGELKWVKMTGGHLPEGALIGGYENEILYIMRAMHEEALTPGKYVPSKQAGYVAWGYEGHKKTEDVEILCGFDGIWVKSESDIIPIGAVEGGYSEVNHELLYVGRVEYKGHIIPGKILCGYNAIWVPTEKDRIPAGALVSGYTEYGEIMFVGRAYHNNILIPGKIAPSHEVCYMAYAGKSVSNTIYEILVLPNARSEGYLFLNQDNILTKFDPNRNSMYEIVRSYNIRA